MEFYLTLKVYRMTWQVCCCCFITSAIACISYFGSAAVVAVVLIFSGNFEMGRLNNFPTLSIGMKFEIGEHQQSKQSYVVGGKHVYWLLFLHCLRLHPLQISSWASRVSGCEAVYRTYDLILDTKSDV